MKNMFLIFSGMLKTNFELMSKAILTIAQCCNFRVFA